jgi:hypothetical protein
MVKLDFGGFILQDGANNNGRRRSITKLVFGATCHVLP